MRMPTEEEKIAIRRQAEAEVGAQMMDKYTQIAHEKINKQHDTEFNEYAEGNGAETIGKIGVEQIAQAYQTLLDYKKEKEHLIQRLEDNEKFWKLEQWDTIPEDGRIRPKSAWLFNTIINKHADAMDNFPEANILPRARDDEQTAKVLSSVVPVILEQNNFEDVYNDVQWYKMKNGTGVYGVFWNNDKLDGMGDIDIKKIGLEYVFWKGGMTDIQDSPNFFQVAMLPNAEIEARYPNIKAGTSNGYLPITPITFNSDDENIDYSDQSAVIDWYYRKRIEFVNSNGIPQTKTILHYCKFTGNQVIYASENDPQYADKGWYEHGKYPYIFDVLYPVEKSVCGMGFIDLFKDEQVFIDKLGQAILENAISNARPRRAVRSDAGLNEEEYLDLNNPLVHFEGNLGEDAIRTLDGVAMPPIFEKIYQSKISQMKDTSGNTAASQGQSSNVTAASGIASLQEAAGKLSRDTTKSAYRSYKKIVEMVIELIREFYNEPRCFRISGETGENEFVDFDNSGLLPTEMGQAFGIDLGNRLPIMDIMVKPQKKSAYSRDTQNQTALNLYNMGFFAPNNADASLACLDMMDFDQIEKIRDKVRQNGTLFDKVMQLEQMLMQVSQAMDMQNGTNLSGIVASQAGANMPSSGANKGKVQNEKGSLSTQAATATREATAPR